MRNLLRDEVAKIAGEYEIGGEVTVFQHDARRHLVYYHEQTHRDNINNTVFGYWLRVLSQFDNEGVIFDRNRANNLYEAAINDVWNTLEGAAVFTEYVALFFNFVDQDAVQWMKSLPSNYLKAFETFAGGMKPLMLRCGAPEFKELETQVLAFLVNGAANAVTECILDHAIALKAETINDFTAMTRHFSRVSIEKIAPLYLRTLAELEFFNSEIVKDDWLLEGPEEIRRCRQYIMALKYEICKTLYKKSCEIIVSDRFRMNKIIEIDRRLRERFSSVPKIEFSLKYSGGSARPELDQFMPPYDTPASSVSSNEAMNIVRKTFIEQNFSKVCISILRHPKTDVYSCALFPVALKQIEHKMAVKMPPRMIKWECAQEDILKIDKEYSSEGLYWLSPYMIYRQDSPKKIYDIATFLQLSAPVYLSSEIYDFNTISATMDAFNRDIELFAYQAPMEGGRTIDIFCLHHRRIRIFFMTSGVINERLAQNDLIGVEGQYYKLRHLSDDECLVISYCLVLSGVRI